jgi:hypothetical protein
MTEIDPYHPVARLVPRSCAIEQVGDDVVTLDVERLQYHAMHEQVFQVLRASDGSRSVDEIAAMVFGRSDEPQVDVTKQALLDLMDAELIAEDIDARERFFSRRAVGKAAAALLLGVVGLPLVKSITAPDAASAQTCLAEWGTGTVCTTGDSCRCLDGCCCRISAAQAFCATAEACGPERLCV